MADVQCAVWVTTEPHLKRFREIHDRTSILDRMRGNYALPLDFPRTKIVRPGQPSREIPVMLLSAGKLTVNADNIVYSHDPKPRYAALRDLSFSTPTRGLEISLVQFDYAPIRYYNLPHISLRVREASVDPLLVTASGAGPFTYLIRRRTKRLFDEIAKGGAVPLVSNFRGADRER